MNLFPLYQLALVTIALHIIGGGFSLWLVWRSFGDWRWTGGLRDRDGRKRHAVARHTFVTEIDRFLVQAVLVAIRLSSLFVATDRYSPILNDLWLLVLVGAVGNAVVALLLAHSSIDHWYLRAHDLKEPT